MILAVFVAVYIGMATGGIPRLKVDRAWIAVAGATLLIVAGALSVETAAPLVEIDAIVLLLGLMILSAQFDLAGFYGRCAEMVVRTGDKPARLLALVVAMGGLLSAVLVNDIVVFALTPVLCAGVRAKGLDPRPFLLALAGAANAGSAATLIGNPQNILIGQAGSLDFFRFILVCGPPAMLACGIVWLVIWAMWRKRWVLTEGPGGALPDVAFDRGAMTKAMIATAALLMLFATPMPREAAALAIAVALMVSRRFASRDLVARVDWNLLLLFAGLFVVTGAFSEAGWGAQTGVWMQSLGFAPDRALPLAIASLVGSNLIGNVPFVVVLLQVAPDMSADTLHALALLSTLAGNLLIVGSVVNLIVAESARQQGVRLGFLDFARVGIPVTLLSMTMATAWLVAGGWLIW